MDINLSKCLSAILLALFRLSFARLPVQIHNIINGKSKKIVDEAAFKRRLEKFDFHRMILRSFGSGVFLCTCLVHLMPEVVQLLCDGYKKSNLSKNDALISAMAQLYICIGFFMIYFTEEFCHWILTKVPSIPIGSRTTETGNDRLQKFVSSIQGKSENSFKIDKAEASVETVVSYVDCNDWRKQKRASKLFTNVHNSATESGTAVENDEPEYQKNNMRSEEASNLSQRQVVSFMFTGTAVILHAFFEGIAIGLQHKKSSNVWFLTIAMMIHSATTLFCVGMQFLAMQASRKSIIVHFIIQALASPAGILVGYSILVGGKLEQTLLIDGYFEALSTGTILYITFFESLSKEKQLRIWRVSRSFSMIIGFSLMCALEYYVFLEKSVLGKQNEEIETWMNRKEPNMSLPVV